MMKSALATRGNTAIVVVVIVVGVIIAGAGGLYLANNSATPTQPRASTAPVQLPSTIPNTNSKLQIKAFVPSPTPAYTQSSYTSYTQSNYSSGYSQSTYFTGYTQSSYSPSYSQSAYQATCSGYDYQDQCILYPAGACCSRNITIVCGNVNGQPSCLSKNDNGQSKECNTFDHNQCRGCVPTSGYGTYCFAKPVIYLYPTFITKVDVSVETTGQIVVSDPLYPKGGWKNVTAHPDGTLYYQNKKYRELFYETNVTDFNKPKNGLIIKSAELDTKLNEYITRLGLTRADERAEFLDFWLPRLKALNSPYILFSVLDTAEKEKQIKLILIPNLILLFSLSPILNRYPKLQLFPLYIYLLIPLKELVSRLWNGAE
jgi:hypothetical protein